MNKYLTKSAEILKVAGNPAAIAKALARKTLGKPKGWKLEDMKPAELSFNRGELTAAAKKLTDDTMRKGKFKKTYNLQNSTDGLTHRFATAKDVPSLAKGMERQKVTNQLDFLKKTVPRRPLASPPRTVAPTPPEKSF